MPSPRNKKSVKNNPTPTANVVLPREHPIAAKLVPEPGQPLNAVRLSGYMGKSPTPDGSVVRIHLSLEDISEYVDVPREAIVHVAEAPESDLPNGGHYFWVNADAPVRPGVMEPQVAARYFSGLVDAQALAAGAGGQKKPKWPKVSKTCFPTDLRLRASRVRDLQATEPASPVALTPEAALRGRGGP